MYDKTRVARREGDSNPWYNYSYAVVGRLERRNKRNYETKELRAPITNTRRIQSVEPEKTSPFDVAQPSGEARRTGTPTTRANESPIKARSVS